MFESISKILEQENFPEQIVEAKNKIAEYAEQEAETLKEAQDTISEAIEGKSGFFSKKGLNDIIEKISNKSVQQLNTIMTDYANQINEIINSFTLLN